MRPYELPEKTERYLCALEAATSTETAGFAQRAISGAEYVVPFVYPDGSGGYVVLDGSIEYLFAKNNRGVDGLIKHAICYSGALVPEY